MSDNIPLFVEKWIAFLLKNEHFYPLKSNEERESLAWAIAWSKYNRENRSHHDNIPKHVLNLLSYAFKLDNYGFHKYADVLEQRIREIIA